MFAEGLDQNKTVESLKIGSAVRTEIMNALADGLERVIRNRANAATHGGHDEEESLPILKEPEIWAFYYNNRRVVWGDTVRDLFFDRLTRSDVIPVDKVKLHLPRMPPLLSCNVYDFIRSTQVTTSLGLLLPGSGSPKDDECIDLADAMEANNSISELRVGMAQFDKMTNLL